MAPPLVALPASPRGAEHAGRSTARPQSELASFGPGFARLGRRLFQPVDIASLVHFRIAFGVIMLWEVLRYFHHGRIGRYFIEPGFHFTYYGFDWVRPWPGTGMYAHFAALGVLAICVTLGLQYRLAATLFFLGFTYVFLLEQARYLNHFYLVCLVSFLMIVVPAHRAGSIDARAQPALASETAPAWALWLLRAQIGIVYVYGGLAKLNPDWLRGEPMRGWLAGFADLPTVGPLLTTEPAAYFFSYGGLLFDLLVVPLLLWRRTRPFAFVGVVIFNVLNAWLFSIGIFPWFMIAASLLFFAPDWPRRLLGEPEQSGSDQPAKPDPNRLAAHSRLPGGSLRSGPRLQAVAAGLLSLYLAVQLLLPLRHHLYPGEVSWTEEGHMFSWHMKLRDKEAQARFFATDPVTNRTWEVDPAAYLTPWQIETMAGRPELTLQFSHFLADELRAAGETRPEIRVQALATLNDRPAQWLVDPAVDLAAQPRNLLPASWIVPLDEVPSQAETR